MTKEKHRKGYNPDINRGAEQAGVYPPTTLDLFPIKPGERPLMQARQQEFTRFNRNFNLIRTSAIKLRSELKSKVGALNEAYHDFGHQEDEVRQSMTVSTAYLKVLEELTQMGASDEDMHTFFSYVLNANQKISQIQEKKIQRMGERQFDITNRMIVDEDIHSILIEAQRQPIPQWFQGNKDEWVRFIGKRCDFMRFLNNDIPFMQKGKVKLYTAPPRSLGYTLPENGPEWLDEFKQGQLPQRTVVEQELEEDSQEKARLDTQREYQRTAGMYLSKLQQQRFNKAAFRIEKERRPLSAGVMTFTDLLFYLDATEEVASHGGPLSDVGYGKHPEYYPDVSRKMRIEAFLKDNYPSPEVMALWIEKHMKNTGFCIDEHSEVSNQFATGFREGIAYVDRSGGRKADTPGLKDRDKNAYRLMNNDLRPLLALLSETDKEYLLGLTDDMRGQEMGKFIQELAHTVVSAYKTRKSAGERVVLPPDIDNFGKNWLQNNWRWAHDVLVEKLYREETVEGGDKGEVVSQPQYVPEPELAEEVKESEQEVDDIKAGNLKGWKVLYALGSGELDKVEIAGNSLEEREQALEQMLRDEGISCSIKRSSVINTLDWVVSVPETDYYLWMGQAFDGEYYKKFKRGKQRIMVQRNPLEGTLTFFLHQKKDWGYFKRSQRN